ncbi:MAG: preprotein translocase subunit SecG [candidate division SR1 bacterium]|nr:preprotein translocase subunit SecG [candidate division SR1 bacterium]
MRTFLIILMILAGVLFVGSVLLMSPKGGIGLGIGGMSGANEYGSKKSLETKLKKVAVVAGVLFVIIALVLPYTLRG